MEEINIKDFLQYYKKYIFLVLMVSLVCVLAIGIYDKIIKVPKYSTYTSLVLVKDDNSESITDTITQNDVVLNQKLVSTYREIIKSRLVLEQVINDMNLMYSVEELSDMIDVQSKENTEILKITVTNEDPKLAMRIANHIADVFDTEINKIYKINNVSIIDKAQLPTEPSNNHFARDIVLAALLGFVGTSAIVFVIFYYDDTLRSVEEIEQEIGTPVIAKIFKDSNKMDLIVKDKPNALASESIRTLRTNLQFSAIDNELQTLLITSPLAGEGKSFVSANLAISFAHTGKKVLLVDCDLRKGRQHNIFKISGKVGLSNLLISDIKKYKSYVVETKIENLSIIPRGIIPPNPSELLNSKKNIALLELLKKHYDMVILDGAPIIGLADSLILSSAVDKVIVVTALNHSLKGELKNTITSLQNINANIAGCVANNVTFTRGGYGNYYYYGSKDEK